MVGRDVAEVDRQLAAGDLACGCGGPLCRWGWARERLVRGVGRLRPRRARCQACLVTHVLLPVSCLLRRADGAEVIGVGLTLKAAGRGHRPVAAVVGVPAATVRRWFAGASAALTSVLALVWAELDPLRTPLPVWSPARSSWSAWWARRPGAGSGWSARCRRGRWSRL